MRGLSFRCIRFQHNVCVGKNSFNGWQAGSDRMIETNHRYYHSLIRFPQAISRVSCSSISIHYLITHKLSVNWPHLKAPKIVETEKWLCCEQSTVLWIHSTIPFIPIPAPQRNWIKIFYLLFLLYLFISNIVFNTYSNTPEQIPQIVHPTYKFPSSFPPNANLSPLSTTTTHHYPSHTFHTFNPKLFIQLAPTTTPTPIQNDILLHLLCLRRSKWTSFNQRYWV